MGGSGGVPVSRTSTWQVAVTIQGSPAPKLKVQTPGLRLVTVQFQVQGSLVVIPAQLIVAEPGPVAWRST